MLSQVLCLLGEAKPTYHWGTHISLAQVAPLAPTNFEPRPRRADSQGIAQVAVSSSAPTESLDDTWLRMTGHCLVGQNLCFILFQ